MFEISAMTLATAIGLLIEDKLIRFEDTKKWLHRLFRLLITVCIAAIPYLILHFALPEGTWSSFCTYFATLLAAMTLAPLTFKKLKI